MKRFWEKVDRSGDGCWEWQGDMSGGHGYGRIMINGRRMLAHRLVYELEVGEIPDGLCVCHHCDNPRCCRPDHLFLGTHVENMADMVTKGRRKGINNGEGNGRAQITEGDVREIRRLRGTLPTRELGARYGLTSATISKIQLKQTWAHVPEGDD